MVNVELSEHLTNRSAGRFRETCLFVMFGDVESSGEAEDKYAIQCPDFNSSCRVFS